MRTLILLLALSIAAPAAATPCDDYRARYNRAKAFGAHDFKCQDRYDGSATSSFSLDLDNYRKFIQSELERRRRNKK